MELIIIVIKKETRNKTAGFSKKVEFLFIVKKPIKSKNRMFGCRDETRQKKLISFHF